MEIFTLGLRVFELSLQVVDFEILLGYLLGMCSLHGLLFAFDSLGVLECLGVVAGYRAPVRLNRTTEGRNRWLDHGLLTAQCLVILESALQAKLEEALARLELDRAVLLHFEEKLNCFICVLSIVSHI